MTPTQQTARDLGLRPGVPVRLKQAVDRYPHFIAPSGATGVVVAIGTTSLEVAMDDPIEGAHPWANRVCWDDLPEYLARDLEIRTDVAEPDTTACDADLWAEIGADASKVAALTPWQRTALALLLLGDASLEDACGDTCDVHTLHHARGALEALATELEP